MSRFTMSAVDAAWLRMDRPTNLMVVTSVMWFDEQVDPDAIRDLITSRLITRFPRFSQRVVEDHGLYWEDVDDFDVNQHLHPTRLPAPADKSALEEFTGTLIGVPLPWNRPLWDLYLIDNLGPGSALVFRMHHCIADGIALARLLLSLTDDPDTDPVDLAEPVANARPSLVSAAFHEAVDVALHPIRLQALAHPRRLLDLGREMIADGAALAKLATLPADHATALRGTAGVDKQVVWSNPIGLDRIRDAGHLTGSTVNDLLLTAVTGALRTHLVRRRSSVHDIRAIVPFNLRPMDQPLPAELGNMFGLVYLQLPLTTADRTERLRVMAQRMRAIKESAEGLVAYAILELVGLAPPAVENLAIDVFASKGTGVMTNVPGPRHAVRLAGTELRGTIGWGPTSGDLGLGVALFSYAGSVTIGLCVDVGLVPDAKTLLSDVVAELEALIEPHERPEPVGSATTALHGSAAP
ncbi:MAG: wax ester/triacylglycerol synthase family O-acyltransferase [Propionibacteriales bacterium]|nr:wax ester/triacylglycerol synthase family O-acyltransferase [Propionibacteriales bacterium]